MTITFDDITGAFLSKITEFEFIRIDEEDREEMIDGYIKRALVEFSKVCEYNLSVIDNEDREIVEDIKEEDVWELLDIISEGMVVQWLKTYLYKQELLENALNTRDFTTYSVAELLLRVGNAYQKAQRDYTQMVREYSYNHGDLTRLHL